MQKVYRTISYSPITFGNMKIIKPWIDLKINTKFSPRLHPAVSICTKKVYSYSDGVILYTGVDHRARYVVIVQYDESTCFRYSNLRSVEVESGQIISECEYLGEADNFLEFEYLSVYSNLPIALDILESYEGYLKWAIHVCGITLYKHNPELLFDDIIKLHTFETPSLDKR